MEYYKTNKRKNKMELIGMVTGILVFISALCFTLFLAISE